MTGRHPADVLDRDSGKVRVLRKRCATCVFRPEGRELFGPERVDEVIGRNVEASALLTCHSTLPYGPYPEFGPAVCAGFWARYGLATAAGRIAKFMLGVVRIAPPADEYAAPACHLCGTESDGHCVSCGLPSCDGCAVMRDWDRCCTDCQTEG